MKQENLIKIIKFVSKLTANESAYIRRVDDNQYTLYINYYTNRFETRPCSGDIRNGLTDVTTIIEFAETKKGGLRIIDAQTRGTLPRPENNWNGWHEVFVKPKLNWAAIKRAHNGAFGKGEAYNMLYTTKKWIENSLSNPTQEVIWVGHRYENANPMENSLIKIKEAV